MVKMYYECIANTFNWELFCCKKKKKCLQWGSCQPCLNIFLVCKWKLINSVKDNLYQNPIVGNLMVYLHFVCINYHWWAIINYLCMLVYELIYYYITIYVYQFSFELWTTLVKSDKSDTRFCLSVWYIEGGGGG